MLWKVVYDLQLEDSWGKVDYFRATSISICLQNLENESWLSIALAFSFLPKTASQLLYSCYIVHDPSKDSDCHARPDPSKPAAGIRFLWAVEKWQPKHS